MTLQPIICKINVDKPGICNIVICFCYCSIVYRIVLIVIAVSCITLELDVFHFASNPVTTTKCQIKMLSVMYLSSIFYLLIATPPMNLTSYYTMSRAAGPLRIPRVAFTMLKASSSALNLT